MFAFACVIAFARPVLATECIGPIAKPFCTMSQAQGCIEGTQVPLLCDKDKAKSVALFKTNWEKVRPNLKSLQRDPMRQGKIESLILKMDQASKALQEAFVSGGKEAMAAAIAELRRLETLGHKID